ncbi:hypothetical protein [Ascidiimonas sp. W6]|uniref:hypothetical protein n=1 Tax=Ascidiimonas meishanensis TaxID=3128903 RepID=UPI0030EB4541
MLLIIFLSVFFAVILYLLFVPVIISIDTVNQNYYLQVKGLAKVFITGDEKQLIKVKLKIFFLNFNFYPLKKKTTKKKELEITEKSSKKKKYSVLNLKSALRILRSFEIKKCQLDIDTGDCIENAKLYPVFVFLNRTKGTFRINFEGKNSLLLCVENRPLWLIRSFINI